MNSLVQDVRYSLRRLLQAPGFALIAVLTLGLGIGANTAIFSFINALLFKPPAGVREPDRIVAVFTSDFSGPLYSSSSFPDFQDLQKEKQIFTDAVAQTISPVNVVRGEQVERLTAEVVSANYFTLLGLRPETGRLLVPSDSAESVIVLSEEAWHARFGSDPALIGSPVNVNGHPYTVVGIAPQHFHGMTTGLAVDAWVPLMSAQHIVGELARRDDRGFAVLARLQPGVNVSAAQARLHVLQQQLFQAYPNEWRDVKGTGRNLSVLTQRAARVPPGQRSGVFSLGGLLLGAVALVLLICCANVANLLLARAAAREREVAIRYSLGARRSIVLRQLLIESTLLALAGGAAGLLIALWVADLLVDWQPASSLPVSFDVSADTRVLMFTALISVFTGLLFGLAPALQTSRTKLLDLLKSERTLSTRHARAHIRDVLVAAQIAIALTLSIGAGLLARTIRNATHVDAGFNSANVVVATVDLGTAGYDEAHARQFYSALQTRVDAHPDVATTTLALRIPLANPGGRRGVRIPDYTPRPGEDMEFPFNIVGPNYFEAMQLPIVRGRAFTAADRAGSRRVVIVNETFARRFWPGQDPIGKQFTSGPRGAEPMEVVGVARDGKYWQIDEAPRPYFYLPYEQHFNLMTLHVRERGSSERVMNAVRDAVRALDPQLPILVLDTMEGQMSRAVLPQRIAGMLVGCFALLSVLLAAIGVYGVTSVLVAQRVPEIGLRVALGASSRQVLRLIVRRALLVAGAGIGAGLLLSAAATRGLVSMLYGVSRFDAISFGGAAVILIAAALLAAYLPARRAMRVDPLIALKSS